MKTTFLISFIAIAAIVTADLLLIIRTGRESTAEQPNRRHLQATRMTESTNSGDSATAVYTRAKPEMDSIESPRQEGAAHSIYGKDGSLISKPNKTGTINLAIKGRFGSSASIRPNAPDPESPSVDMGAVAGRLENFGSGPDPNPSLEYGTGLNPNESQVFGPEPGENESQVYGPGPGENEPQVFGSGPDPDRAADGNN